MRLGSLATETAALREDNEVLTHILVETKVLYAELQSEWDDEGRGWGCRGWEMAGAGLSFCVNFPQPGPALSSCPQTRPCGCSSSLQSDRALHSQPLLLPSPPLPSDETMRLQQRLKRSLQSEHSIRNANEDLLLKLHEAEPTEAAEVSAAGRPARQSTYLVIVCHHVPHASLPPSHHAQASGNPVVPSLSPAA